MNIKRVSAAFFLLMLSSFFLTTPFVQAKQPLVDPEGRLFDSQSLEPIPTGEILLLNSLHKVAVLNNAQNPQSAKVNGAYVFWSPSGTYYLNLGKIPQNYSWPTKLERVNGNYSKAYFCDSSVKNENNQPAQLYTKAYPIPVLNSLVHCDIPLDPGSSPPYRTTVKTIDFSIQRLSDSSFTYYSGNVSHPLTTIILQGEKTGKVVTTKSADKFGFWEAVVDNSSYPVGADGSIDRLVAVYQKNDLTGATRADPVKGAVFEPLLTYVEGYAYDASGVILPLALVGYRQLGDGKVVNVTTADSKGFFRIPTTYLPSFGYELIFTAGGKVIRQTTSQFIAKNTKYLKDNNLHLLTDVKTGTLPQNPLLQKAKADENEKAEAAAQEKKNESTTGNILLIGFILIFLLAASVGAVVLIKKKQSSQLPVQ